MDLITPLHALLDRLLGSTTFVLDEIDPLDTRTGRTYGVLEYHGALDDGRIVMFGCYQFAAQRTIIAEMWIPDDVGRIPPEAGIGSHAHRRRVWSYGPEADGEELARAIVTEVVTWLAPTG